MTTIFKKVFSFFFLFLLCTKIFSQYGQLPPFTISMEAITGTAIPGVHSFAFAQSGDKWLIIGGRTNGLHGLNSNDGFPAEYKNDNVIVIDTSTWTYYAADLNQLPQNIADPMRSTNMEYIQDGNYLYMAGGFGFDSIASIYVTFPTLTAIHVDNMISAVMNAQPIAPYIRQVADTNLAVCGGDLGKIGNDFYLCFGHNFGGRYADPPVPTFTQKYSERIKKFNLTDNGTTISLNNYSYLTDTTNFHRRDLNVGPVVRPDGSFALEAYGGVFQKMQNLPFREPITITATGTTVNTGYQQVMSHYSCAGIPAFDSLSGSMYNTFLGGISLYDYDTGTNLVARDTLVPFISDITTMTTHSNGTVEETVLPVQLPGLLGANARFVLNPNIAHYSNEVIHLRNLPNTKILAGYLFGGIRAEQGNFGNSIANDTVYRIFITPNNTTIGIEEPGSLQNAVVFPNPSSQSTSVLFSLNQTERVNVMLLDVTGKELQNLAEEKMQAGNHQVPIDTSKLPAGVYFCKVQSERGGKILKVVVSK